jgi:hypothetical protein
LAVGFLRALPERFIALRAAGLAAFFFAVFAMFPISLSFPARYSAQIEATILACKKIYASR